MSFRKSGRIRRFRFNLPQRIAAGLLALFVVQGLWLIAHNPQTDFAGPSLDSQSDPTSAISATSLMGSPDKCTSLPQGILACYLTRTPLALASLALPELKNSGGQTSFAQNAASFLMRLPFLAVGVLLGGALWWVTRRLFGNCGGYTALALYCFSPAVLHASTTSNAAILASLAVYGGIYTAVGVAHAMQGPMRKWRPRLVLLTAIFAVAATSHLVAFLATGTLGLALMLWVAEGKRRVVVPLLLLTMTGALAVTFVGYGLSVSKFIIYLQSETYRIEFSLQHLLSLLGALFLDSSKTGFAVALLAAMAIFLLVKKSRYFGNTAPLLCAICLVMVVISTSQSGWANTGLLCAIPFLLTFISGTFADAYESSQGRLAIASAGLIVLLQVVICIATISRISWAVSI
jgi:hypothetical protein